MMVSSSANIYQLYRAECNGYDIYVSAQNSLEAREVVHLRMAPVSVFNIHLSDSCLLDSHLTHPGVFTVRKYKQNNEYVCLETIDHKGRLTILDCIDGTWSTYLHYTAPSINSKAITRLFDPTKEAILLSGILQQKNTFTPFQFKFTPSDFTALIKQWEYMLKYVFNQTMSQLKDVIQKLARSLWSNLDAPIKGNWSVPSVTWTHLDNRTLSYEIRFEWNQRVPYQPRYQGITGVPYVSHTLPPDVQRWKGNRIYCSYGMSCQACRKQEDHVHIVAQHLKIPQNLLR